ncbi:hypothetical protein PN466_14325 [Roseofilum reptotaenium CS-1145]|nr:hypothetical protein [Roseofilum reptotaenium CS-1145]
MRFFRGNPRKLKGLSNVGDTVDAVIYLLPLKWTVKTQDWSVIVIAIITLN